MAAVKMTNLTKKAQKVQQNKYLDLYREIFTGDHDEIRRWIMQIQSAARQYVPAEVEGVPVGIRSTSLEKRIDKVYGLKLKLSTDERQALVNMLVNYHDLRNLKPWNDTLMLAMW